MAPRHIYLAGGIALALAATWLYWPVDPAGPAVHAGIALPVQPAAIEGVAAAHESAPLAVAPGTIAQPPAALRTVPATTPAMITAAAPSVLPVGDQQDLVVTLGTSVDVAEVTFTVRFDGSVLQVRNGAEGDWATVTGSRARFSADISGRDDEIRIQSAVSPARMPAASYSVALVQFQAISPGTAAVTISDVTVKDREGRAVPFLLSPFSLQVTAESHPAGSP